MAAANWDACFKETELWEGWHKFSDNPHDPGGATWCGLTQRAYDAWRSHMSQPRQDVRKASDDEIEAIFHHEYWDPVKGNDLWPGLDLEMFDMAINQGVAEGVKILQRALGIMADGWFGLETLNAVQASTDRGELLRAVHDGRMGFWRSLPIWRWFGPGWTNRETGVYERAKQMLAGAS